VFIGGLTLFEVGGGLTGFGRKAGGWRIGGGQFGPFDFAQDYACGFTPAFGRAEKGVFMVRNLGLRPRLVYVGLLAPVERRVVGPW